MASKCFYLNVVFTFFILNSITADLTVSQPEHALESYEVDELENYVKHEFVTLDRNKRQNPPPMEKKNEGPSADKSKITKKPTSMDIKPTSGSTDANDKQKAKDVTGKKESLSTKIVATNPTPEGNGHEHPEELEHGKATDVAHVDHDHPLSPETIPHPVVNATSEETPIANTTKAPPKKTTPTVLTNITVPGDEIQADKFLKMYLNETFKEHNITSQQEDHHLYYNSTVVLDPEVVQNYWVDMDKLSDVKDILANSHRKAVTVKLSFDFPFYGHLIRKVVIATGGFLYTGEYVHSWLSVTQYIAPLMANFDTASSNHSSIKYVDNGTAFTVQWENVVFQDKPDEGNFTFQCTLFKSGNIIFVYKHISVPLDNIGNSQHPIKVGLSDAYIIDRTIFTVRKKTIYEYHRVNFERDQIRNGTAILLSALDTCLDMTNCRSCVTEVPVFECNWCANRCSNGYDRYRQDWIAKGCTTAKKLTVEECAAEEVPSSIVESQSSAVQSSDDDGSMNVGIAGIMAILFVICISLGLGVWLFYAYRNPHTPAGQFLIRYRPSQWSWRRGEARYTAATIHM